MTKGIKGFQKGHKYFGPKSLLFKKGHKAVGSWKIGDWQKGRPSWNKGLSKELQPNYKDGRSDFRGDDWREQRAKCLKRDKRRCTLCNKRRKRMSVHHKVDWFKTHDNRLGNLVTVCNICHPKIHKK